VIELAEIRAARERIADIALTTPLVRLDGTAPGGAEIHLKLETPQPIGSFKIRGAANAVRAGPNRCARRAWSQPAPATWHSGSPT
jgi:threonine dehydratase